MDPRASRPADNLVQLQRGAKSYGSKDLFVDASFAVNEGEHVGVIGPNGAGKTTLFKILVGEESLDSGQLIKSRQLRMGYLSQHDHWTPGETVESFIERDATLPLWELKPLGRGLGFDEEHYGAEIATLSGGYRMRAKLLRLLGQQPNLMLLDEPTNYLDLETLMVLEKFLQSYEGAFLLISHDREFLRRTTDHILEVESGDITKFNGMIDDYFEQKEMLRAQLAARALSLAEKRKQVLDFVARFGAKASKASQAQSRLKSLDKMEAIEVKALPVTARIRIPPPARQSKITLTIQRGEFGYGDRVILSDVHLQLAGSDHLAVVGLNGAGKSTLLKALAGRLEPRKGTLQLGYEVTLAFFNQFVAEELLPTDTVVQALQRKAHPDVLPQDILDLAGSLLFSGDSVRKPVSVLSGGERARVALGQVLLQKASCLILDEPTNHLDFQTVEALTQALHAYTGSLIIVSHDRGFIRRIGNKILEVRDGKALTYLGSYDDYVWSLERSAAGLGQTAEATPKVRAQHKPSPADEGPKAATQSREQRKEFEKRKRQLDQVIGEMTKKSASLHTQLADLNAELVASADAVTPQKIAELGRIQHEIEECEARWMKAEEEKEALSLLSQT